MSKSKKRKNVCQDVRCDNEGKYQKLCQEYRERDELEVLNRKVEERTAQWEKILWEQEARAENRRIEEERRVNAILRLIGLLILFATIGMGLVALAITEVFPWWISGPCVTVCGLVAAFKSGYLWHEIKK